VRGAHLKNVRYADGAGEGARLHWEFLREVDDAQALRVGRVAATIGLASDAARG
jgi:hypothetical protein